MYRCFEVAALFSIITACLAITITKAQNSADSITKVTAQSTSTMLPVEAFTKFDEFGGIKLSPSGKYAVFMTGKYGRKFMNALSNFWINT